MVAESNMMIGTIVAKMRSFIEFMVLMVRCNYFDRARHEFIRLIFFIKKTVPSFGRMLFVNYANKLFVQDMICFIFKP